eukprot:TRINITY_DN6439_c0_g1_i1.p1 TRINITY_DN6439_c0_g1~~TRINITY_DN6439_c0_g1_i1.p1  ORF type:complete len:142 (-),score=24.92 TRINITY_DN6439_c0_g1_i1:197-622(-)
MINDFWGSSYDLLTKNCNHFSDAFSRKLVGKGIPNYINRLAWYGSFFPCFLPPSLRPPTASALENAGPPYPLIVPFSGTGNRLDERESPMVPLMIQEDPNDRRAKLLDAANRRLQLQNQNADLFFARTSIDPRDAQREDDL